MSCRHLADTENRGKLNLAEFHVAMGLIYRGAQVKLMLGPSVYANFAVLFPFSS